MVLTIKHNSTISCEKPQSAALQLKVRMGCTAVLPIRTFFMSAPHLTTFDKKLGPGANISCDSVAICDASIKSPNGTYVEYYPSGDFSCQRHICTTLTRNWAYYPSGLFSCQPHILRLLTRNWVVRLIFVVIREFSEFNEFKVFAIWLSLNSLNSLNSLIKKTRRSESLSH